jgi:hypothetical protein
LDTAASAAVVSLLCWPQTTLVLAWLMLKSAKLWPATVPRGHDMSKSATQSLHNMDIITHWTHLEEMKKSNSGFLAVLAANNLGFGLLALAEIYA